MSKNCHFWIRFSIIWLSNKRFPVNFINNPLFSFQLLSSYSSKHSLFEGITTTINGILELLRLCKGEIKVLTPVSLNHPLQYF